MVSVFMISRKRLATLVFAPAALFLIETSCDRVPLLAPSGSTVTLTTASSVLPINGTAVVIAQVIEGSGTAPQSGTHVTFTTSLGTIKPADAQTDSSGRATAIFTSDSSGTATIAALSGAATTGASPLKILVGTAAVQKVVINASPATVPSLGGSTSISATVFDVNGNLMDNVPVTFTTTAGTLSAGVVNTTAAGNATVTLTTAISATVTASVGVGASTSPTTPTTPGGTTPTTPTTPSASGTASASVVVNIAAAPTIVITPPTTAPSAGLPASFTIAVTVPATNGSAVKDVTVDWGDQSSTDLGAVTGSAVIAHVYKDAGSYAVKVTATDASGNTVTVTSVVTVIVAASPTIIITPNVPATHSSSMVVSFVVQVTVPSGVGVTSVTINFGDGVTSSLGGLTGTATVTHNYGGTVGPQNITVTVIDTLNRTTTGQTSITLP
jgi:PKD domain